MGKEKKKKFEVTGAFIERNSKKKFLKTVGAVNEKAAKENLLAIFGSNHKLKRRQIFVEEIKEVI